MKEIPHSPHALKYALTSQSDNFADYFLVTNQDIEFYKVSSAKVAKKPVRSIPCNIAYHWYLPEAQFLLTVDSLNVFQGFLINSRGVTLVSQFEINNNPNFVNSTFDNRAFYHQVSLHILYVLFCIDFGIFSYDTVSCMFIHEKTGQLYIYQLENKSDIWSLSLAYTLDLFTPGRFEVSVLDEILIVHNLHHKLPMLFDVRSASTAPIVAPLPMEILSFDGSSVPCICIINFYTFL